jgi:hypothetical protein
MLRNLSQDRLVPVLVLILAVAGLMALASSMPDLQLIEGGIIFEIEERPRVEEEASGLTDEVASTAQPNTGLIVLGLVALLVLLYLAYRSREFRYALLAMGMFTVFLLLMIYLYRNAPPPDEQTAEEPLLTQAERLWEQLPETPPAWFDNVTVAVTALIFVACGVGIWVLWRRWQPDRKDPLQIVGDEAQATLLELRSGADLRDAILRCYYDMNQALVSNLGLRRDQGMTPREFEAIVTAAGLPATDVAGLTRLFEHVRYGAVTTGDDERGKAMTCLENIVAASQNQSASPGRSLNNGARP